MNWLRRLFHRHKFVELERYLMFTGEDHIFYECEVCGKKTYDYSLDTYYGKASAKPYQEWIRERSARA